MVTGSSRALFAAGTALAVALGFSAWRLAVPRATAVPESAPLTGAAYRASVTGRAELRQKTDELLAKLGTAARPELPADGPMSGDQRLRVMRWADLMATEERFTDNDAQWLLAAIANPGEQLGAQITCLVALLDALAPAHPDGRTPAKLRPETDAQMFEQVRRLTLCDGPTRRQATMGGIMFYGYYRDPRYAKLVRDRLSDENQAVAAYARHCMTKATDFPKEP